MGSSLIVLGVLALLFAYSKKHGWDRDCLIGSLVAISAGILINWIG
jgi:hypothetical protein